MFKKLNLVSLFISFAVIEQSNSLDASAFAAAGIRSEEQDFSCPGGVSGAFTLTQNPNFNEFMAGIMDSGQLSEKTKEIIQTLVFKSFEGDEIFQARAQKFVAATIVGQAYFHGPKPPYIQSIVDAPKGGHTWAFEDCHRAQFGKILELVGN